tara:strand:- start:194 stop:424 length:231 start_codon:yes stop_codon:yes gene_type:complete
MENIELKKEPPLDTLKVIKNDDDSFTFEWDPEDPLWSWMNDVSPEEITEIIENYANKVLENEEVNSIVIDDSLTPE